MIARAARVAVVVDPATVTVTIGVLAPVLMGVPVVMLVPIGVLVLVVVFVWCTAKVLEHVNVVVEVFDPPVIRSGGVIDCSDVGLDVQDRRPVEEVEGRGVQGTALDLDEADDGQPDRARSVGRAAREDPDRAPRSPRRADETAGAGPRLIEVAEEDHVSEAVERLETREVLAIDDDAKRATRRISKWRLVGCPIRVGRPGDADGAQLNCHAALLHGPWYASRRAGASRKLDHPIAGSLG
jgi:hypothetical protein